MPKIVHEGLNISYEDFGQGDPVLFLPGTSTDSSSWLPSVAAHMGEWRSIMVDPRDTPKSDQARAPYRPADLAVEALAVADAAGVDSFHLLGYSLGGTVAQELALAAPERVRSLTLLNTWARTDSWLRHCFEWLRDGLNGAGLNWAHRALVWLTFGSTFQEGSAYEGALSILRTWAQTPEALARQLECDIAHDALDRLGNLKCPTLVIGGGLDIWFPVRYPTQVAGAIPGARLEIFPEAFHSLPLERAQDLFPLFKSHLQGAS